MKNKTGRPLNKPVATGTFHDLEGKFVYLHIPPGFINSGNMADGVLAVNNGTETGQYGRGKYGRCLYSGLPSGIYGTDTYSNCEYK